MQKVFTHFGISGIALFLCTGCVEDTRVDSLIHKLNKQEEQIAELQEQIRILNQIKEEQASLNTSLQEMKRQLAEIELKRTKGEWQPTLPAEVAVPRPYGVDINQGETKAQIIEVAP